MGRKLFFPTGTDWVVKKDISASPAPLREKSSAESPSKSATSGSGAGGRSDSLENLSSVPVGLRIIEHLREGGPATQKGIGKALGVGITTVSYNLRNLVDEGKVEKIEEKHGAMYELVENS